MQTRSWDGQDGQKRYRSEIVADRIQFGPKSSAAGGSFAKQSTKDDDREEKAPAIEYPEEEISADDIPF